MKYRKDIKGTGLYLRESPELRAELHRRARIGLTFAAARARKRTGRQAASGHVEDAGIGGVKKDRMQVDVVFDVPYSAAREFGNKRSRAEGNLRAAVPIIERG